MVKSIVVTGGAGAIGCRLVKRLLDDGTDRILVVDDLSSGHEWLLARDSRIQLFKMDVCNLVANPEILNSAPTAVYHLAAFFANQNSVDHPLQDLHTNAQGTLATLMWASSFKAGRLVYASAGCSIAGHGIDAPIKEDMPVSLNLDTPYQITKALGEFYCNYFLPQMSTVRCRFFNSYGPGELPGPYRNVIPNFIWRALHHRPLLITGNGTETRDFIFVDDLVDGLVRCANIPAAHGESFNLGTGKQTTVRDLASMIIRLADSKSAIEYRPRRSWDHSMRRQADISKSRSLLGFSPSVSVEQGLARTVAWFREHRDLITANDAAQQVLQ